MAKDPQGRMSGYGSHKEIKDKRQQNRLLQYVAAELEDDEDDDGTD